jgi:hypothetical protein
VNFLTPRRILPCKAAANDRLEAYRQALHLRKPKLRTPEEEEKKIERDF